jgi:hypothetical protein
MRIPWRSVFHGVNVGLCYSDIERHDCVTDGNNPLEKDPEEDCARDSIPVSEGYHTILQAWQKPFYSCTKLADTPNYLQPQIVRGVSQDIPARMPGNM